MEGMLWRYEESTGRLWLLVAQGFSGADPDPSIKGEPGEGVNDPSKASIRSTGPIPRGMWIIGPMHDTESHGPCVMALSPMIGTETFGRSGFLIHGDSVKRPGSGSLGCIIMPREVRQRIASSGVTQLEVVT